MTTPDTIQHLKETKVTAESQVSQVSQEGALSWTSTLSGIISKVNQDLKGRKGSQVVDTMTLAMELVLDLQACPVLRVLKVTL